jgi:hypothetical protein
MKRLMGKTDVENAFERLDTLTKEENLMAAARTFEATHDVNVNVKAIQELTQHVDTKVTVIEEVLQQVDGSIRATQEGTRTIVDTAQSRQAGMGDSLLTDSQAKGINKCCAKPPIVMKLAVKERLYEVEKSACCWTRGEREIKEVKRKST